ncbi:unnamed protein product [Bursaphelenchus okinawaensis]|uniref:Uncharacterized protein n=1 Tax=Bursaphelenchus okinawaensis TaxID=465554 RepID=A0A811KTB5_9BILA|nr:unnamed protein product [Bursaphelenchus okinawaensis]CAG9112920.1 unnamed protein product [Bursaphelenchus okinawaensis]
MGSLSQNYELEITLSTKGLPYSEFAQLLQTRENLWAVFGIGDRSGCSPLAMGRDNAGVAIPAFSLIQGCGPLKRHSCFGCSTHWIIRRAPCRSGENLPNPRL